MATSEVRVLRETQSVEVPEVSLEGLKEQLDEMHAKTTEGFGLVDEYQITKDVSTKERSVRLFEDARLIANVLNSVLPLGGLDTWATKTVVAEESPQEESEVEVIAAGPH